MTRLSSKPYEQQRFTSFFPSPRSSWAWKKLSMWTTLVRGTHKGMVFGIWEILWLRGKWSLLYCLHSVRRESLIFWFFYFFFYLPKGPFTLMFHIAMKLLHIHKALNQEALGTCQFLKMSGGPSNQAPPMGLDSFHNFRVAEWSNKQSWHHYLHFHHLASELTHRWKEWDEFMPLERALMPDWSHSQED